MSLRCRTYENVRWWISKKRVGEIYNQKEYHHQLQPSRIQWDIEFRHRKLIWKLIRWAVSRIRSHKKISCKVVEYSRSLISVQQLSLLTVTFSHRQFLVQIWLEKEIRCFRTMLLKSSRNKQFLEEILARNCGMSNQRRKEVWNYKLTYFQWIFCLIFNGQELFLRRHVECSLYSLFSEYIVEVETSLLTRYYFYGITIAEKYVVYPSPLHKNAVVNSSKSFVDVVSLNKQVFIL